MIISFINQKGGSGKTTCSINYAFECAFRYGPNLKIMLVDADEQRSILKWSEMRSIPLPHNISISGKPYKKLHRDIISEKDDYKLIIIDTPGRETDITRSAILASDIVIVPCKPSQFDVDSTMDILDILRDATELSKPDLAYFFLINDKEVNTIVGQDLREKLEKMGDDIFVLKTELTHRVAWIKSSEGLSVHELKNANPCKIEISSLFTEIEEISAALLRR